jgi:hypothetical protein
LQPRRLRAPQTRGRPPSPQGGKICLLAKGSPKQPTDTIGDVIRWTYTGNKLHPTQLIVRYDPRDLSHLFVMGKGLRYRSVPYGVDARFQQKVALLMLRRSIIANEMGLIL